MLKTGHVLLVLMLVMFGLFLATAFGYWGPTPDPSGDFTVTIFTDLPSEPDAPAMGLGSAMGFGWVVLGLGLLSGMLGFVSAALAAVAAFAIKRCQSLTRARALLN
jgi:hypothetical protein